MASILVVGCGDIGGRVALALHSLGHRVVGLKRRPPEISAPFPMLTIDIRRVESLRGIAHEFDLVLFIVSPASRQAESYQALYQTGLENMLAHFTSAACRPKWLMVSSSSVYGQNQGEWVDEDSPAQPLSAASQCLVEAEQSLWAADESHCVVRFSGIYGPGRDWLLRRAAQGDAIQQTPPSYTNRIHRDDCVGVLLFLINKLLAGDQLLPCYLATDNDPAPLWEVMHWIAEQYGFPVPVALNLADEAPQNKRCNNARLTALGYKFLFPGYRNGYVNSAAGGFVK
ncbi:MAG: SDR family oxidoreductase [Methylomonas sp.]|jgi:nucleoside-diphosphate-sugar epimerase|uniref:SDR family oxidoreductase n=1 Tax=Methylomonas sp. TaxID=418 RepID=UPI0025FCE732|nr:SDR family oxidoreductase [Methylomonas sp.]MCK9609298.1 SDR family oxidoreductase [Methylomonas sp.]